MCCVVVWFSYSNKGFNTNKQTYGARVTEPPPSCFHTNWVSRWRLWPHLNKGWECAGGWLLWVFSPAGSHGAAHTDNLWLRRVAFHCETPSERQEQPFGRKAVISSVCAPLSGSRRANTFIKVGSPAASHPCRHQSSQRGYWKITHCEDARSTCVTHRTLAKEGGPFSFITSCVALLHSDCEQETDGEKKTGGKKKAFILQ